MLHGNLANHVSYTIGFRCIGLLVKYKEDSFSDRVLNAVLGKVKRAEVDEKVRSAMEYLYRQTEYNVDLVIENKDYTHDLKVLLDDLPFNRVVLVDKMSQVSQRLLTGDLTIYVDDDDYRRSQINSPYAIPLSELNKHVRLFKR